MLCDSRPIRANSVCLRSAYNRSVGKFIAFLALLASLAMGAAWYSVHRVREFVGPVQTEQHPKSWLLQLYSQNPREAEQAVQQLSAQGAAALPTIRAALQNPSAPREERKAALKACAVLGEVSAPIVADVAAELQDPELTAEAAVALSFMGPDAFPPLRDALADHDPTVRREALRSIGKLRFRAPLDARAPLSLLRDGMNDADSGVRAVAVTYLGILHAEPTTSIPLLVTALEDEDFAVRRAAATALGSFGVAADQAIPALRKATNDADEDVAREAGLSIVKIQTATKK